MKKTLIITSFSILLIGFYNLILLSNIISIDRNLISQLSRGIMLLSFLVLAINFPKGYKTSKSVKIFFSLFVFLYSFRILYDYVYDIDYYMTSFQVFVQFLLFCVLPFLCITNISFNKNELKLIFKTFLIMGTCFPILIYANFGEYLGKVTRLSHGFTGDDDLLVSPLILSYNSAFIIGICLNEVFFKKLTAKVIVFYLVLILLSMIPFSLGASIGSVLAVLIPLLITLYIKFNVRLLKKYFFYFVIFVLSIIYYSDTLFAGLINRFSLKSDFNNSSQKDTRSFIWEQSLSQFYDNPFLGDKLAVDNWENYPHNLFIESLQTMGIIGFVFILILMFTAFKYSINILKKFEDFDWVSVLFFQVFIQSMVSFSIYSTHYLWTSVALVIAVHGITKKNKRLI